MQVQLQGCIDDERQFKMANRAQAPRDATVRKRIFRDNFVIFRRRSKTVAYLRSVNFCMCDYMQISNFRDGHVTNFGNRSGTCVCQMPDHRITDSPD